MASQIKVDQITDKLGTGTPSFPHGIDAGDLTGTLPALDASALTNLDAGDLTGALPALDGSAVTDLNAAELTGALPAIDGSALTGVGASTTYGAVGTYAFLYRGGSVTEGTTYAGSGLQPAGALNWNALGNDSIGSGTDTYVTKGGSAVSGTWRCMGRVNYSGKVSLTLYVRIS